MKLSIYIAGRITGEDPEKCKQKFAKAEAFLKSLGVDTVINPLNIGIPIGWTWAEAKELCLKVLGEKANCLYLLKDYLTSPGALEEYKWVKTHGYRYRIFFEDDVDTDIIKRLVAHDGQWKDTSKHEFP